MRKHQFGTILLALVAGAALFQTNSPFALAELSQSEANSLLAQKSTYQLAQAPQSSCRKVIAPRGLYVRQEPTSNSKALGIVASERNVTIKNRGASGWVPISAPLEGYVYGGFLGYCQEDAPPPSSCRQVQTSSRALNVRREPTANGTIVGAVANGRRVTIENRGANGWVPITVPLVGYVSSDYLIYCNS